MKTLQTIILVTAVIFSSNADAGAYNPAPLEIICDPADCSLWIDANGSMGNARFSANEFEFIGCRLRGFPDGGGMQVQCEAQDATGTVKLSCTSSDVALVATVQAISTYSWILFGIDNTGNNPLPPYGGECTQLFVSTRSFQIPDTQNQNPGRSPN